MKIRQQITVATLNAVAALLAPHVEGITATSLVEALKRYNDGAVMSVAETRPMTRRQVAELLQMHVSSVNRLLNAGLLRRTKITGRTVRIDRGSVEALLAGEATAENGEG